MQKINHPIAIFHGIGENCDGTMKYWAEYLGKKLGVYSRCIEYGRGTESIFHDIQTLSEKACDIVNLDENFNNGFNIIGFSQGGLVGRYVLERCQTKGDVKRFITAGTPHMGEQKIPCLAVLNYFCEIVDKFGQYLLLIPGLEKIFAPVGYVRTPELEDFFLKNNKFLAPLNNEISEKDSNIKSKITKLEKMILIKFSKDEVIKPRESAWFQKLDKNHNLEEFKKSDFYLKDYLGIRELNESNRLQLNEFKGFHMRWSQEEIDNIVVPGLTS